MNKTTNYQLNQWAKDDQVRMEDFNADNARIDAALAGLAGGKADVSALTALAARVGVLEPLTLSRVAHGSIEGDNTDGRVFQLPWEAGFAVLMGKINSKNAVAFVVPGTGIYSTGLEYYFSPGFVPELNGSTLVFPCAAFFNRETTYYCAIR